MNNHMISINYYNPNVLSQTNPFISCSLPCHIEMIAMVVAIAKVNGVLARLRLSESHIPGRPRWTGTTSRATHPKSHGLQSLQCNGGVILWENQLVDICQTGRDNTVPYCTQPASRLLKQQKLEVARVPQDEPSLVGKTT